MRIYTRTGDGGQTGLIGGERISKASLRIEAVGAVDELNAAIGLARVDSQAEDVDEGLGYIQNWLFQVGGELAAKDGTYATLGSNETAYLERDMDRMTESLPPLRNFILPGGTDLGAKLHFARTICRRAERTVQALAESEGVRQQVLVFLNRLSDWLFTAARTANRDSAVGDIAWRTPEGFDK